jgi:hypothetical protein
MLTMLSPASRPAYTEENPRKFGVYYGERLDPQLSAFDVLVLDADSGLDLARIRKRAKARQLILGYLALCEVDPSRSYCCCTNRVIGRGASISTYGGLNGSGWSSTKSSPPF